MATYTWAGGNGAFDNAIDWNPALVPSAGDTALLTGPVGTVSGTGSVYAMVFANAGWVMTGQFTTGSVNVEDGAVAIGGGVAQMVVNGLFAVGGGAGFSVTGGASLAVSGGASFSNSALSINSRAVSAFDGALALGAGGVTNGVIDAAVLTVGGVFSLGTTAGSGGYLSVQDGAQVVVAAPYDGSTSYLQLGAVAGANSDLHVDGSGSLLLLSQDSAAVGAGGSGELDVTGGGGARFTSGNNAQNPALVIGQRYGASGTVLVSGGGSTVTTAGSVIIGEAGAGAMTIAGGGVVTSAGLTSAQAALSVGADPYSAGTLSIQGAGSQFIASGVAVIGGDNRGTGTSAGGTGTVSISGGGLLQSYGMTIEAGSSVSIDGSSQETIQGDLSLAGSLSNAGVLSIGGALSGGGTLTLGGGYTGVATLAQANVAFSGANATLRVNGLYGTSSVSGMQSGDVIDIAGAATISGNTVSAGGGSLVLSGSGPFTLGADGNGGTLVSFGTEGEDTIGVFRFFDSDYGTHFFTSSVSEESSIMATRPDLVYEGVGLQAVNPSDADPNASPVYRFFDSDYGTHFFTASAAERDQVIASRPDLVYEGTGFLEHTTQQPGDVGVYRFFDTRYGTHFYTADPNERAMIIATRPDLVDEGIGFYAPSS